MSASMEIETEVPSYEVVGPRGAPAIVVLGGISAGRHVCGGTGEDASGWWESVVGAGRAIDTASWQVVSFDYLGGGRDATGRPERVVTTHDQADALAAVLDAIGIDRVHAVVGASYGGMTALAFAESYPDRLARLVAIGAAHRSHSMTTALRGIQRRIVELGLDTGRANDAMVLARALAMTTYRTGRELEARFDAAPSSRPSRDVTFPVESYLLKHGERFAARHSPERFLALSLSADLHEVNPARIVTPTVLVAAEGDTLVPREQLEQLASAIGPACHIVDLPTIAGHDGFLTEPQAIGPILFSALTSSIPS